MDNGNVSSVALPATFLLIELKGKTVKEQISSVMTARCKEIDRFMKELDKEKAALEGVWNSRSGGTISHERENGLLTSACS